MSIAKSNTNDLASLFKEGFFKIPPFQRRYSWESKQQLDLLNDLVEAYETNAKHFLGTLSLQLINSMGFDSYYHIIDGQQRFTTLIILYSCLSRRSSNNQYSQYLIKNNQYFLEPINIDEKNFLSLVLSGESCTPVTQSQRLMLQARTDFDKRLKISAVKSDELLNFILNNTIFLIYLVDDYTASIRMFESINDRGLLLGYFDKIKSFFMYYSDKYLKRVIDDEIQLHFDVIYNFLDKTDLILGVNNDETLLLYHYLSNPVLFSGWSYTKSTQNIYLDFKKSVLEFSHKNINEGKKYIINYLNDIVGFINSALDIEEKIDKNLLYREFYLYLEPNQRMFPLSIRFNQMELLDDSIQMLEKVEFYLKFRKDPKKDIFKLLKDVIDFKGSKSDLLCIINNSLYYIYQWQTEAIDIVNNANWAAKYALYKLNIHENQQVISHKFYKLLEVEHIFSTNPSFPVEDYGFDDNSYHHLLNNIGNLTLLEKELNGSNGATNKIPKDKIEQNYINSQVILTQKISVQSMDDVKMRTQQIDEFLNGYFFFELKKK